MNVPHISLQEPPYIIISSLGEKKKGGGGKEIENTQPLFWPLTACA